MKNYPKNILVVRTDRIGDVVLTLPAASIIKKHFPDSKVTFLLRDYTAPLAEDNNNVDQILFLKTENEQILFGENIRQLKKEKFDACLVVSPNFKLAMMLKLAGIKNIIGTGYRWYSFLFKNKIFEHRKYADHHELEFNVRMLKQIGIDEKITPETAVFGIQQNEQADQKVRQFLENRDHDFSKKTVIVHPGSGGSAVDWPISRFNELIELMARELDINVILSGSEDEKALCENLVCGENVKNLAGLFGLKEFISLINIADLMMANSTGPIHIASALGKQVIGFYPKIIASSKERWGPYTPKAKVFNPGIGCTNCTRKQCEELDCMNSIEPAEVFESLKKMLED